MQILRISLITILIVMSLVAGVAKVLNLPQELEFLGHLGMGERAVMVLGTIQVLGGLLLIWPRTRMIGALLAVAGLAVSALALFVNGNSSVGLITLFPIAIGISLIMEAPGSRA